MSTFKDALQDSIHDAVSRAQPQHQGRVVGLSPITVELDDSHFVLSADEDLELSQWADFYNQTWRIRNGDTVLLVHLDSWCVLDVLNDEDMDPDLLSFRPRGDAGGDLDGTFPRPIVRTVLNGRTPATEEYVTAATDGLASVTYVDAAVSRLASRIALVTRLPASPADGDEIYFLASDTDGIIWHLRYRSASRSTYKWEVLGAPPPQSVTDSGGNPRNTSSTTFQTTGAPSITTALAGQYDAEWGANNVINQASSINDMRLGLFINGSGNGTATVIDEQFCGGTQTFRTIVTVTTAGHVIDVRHRSLTGVSADFWNPFLRLYPRRVG